ncbi:MAG: hypothetical protein G3M78_00665 [Candidatus Nitrohelix vancouverensis]|uniref:Uncharacterized protein n=1 Tax=Candidatus Nitrohelix vancouverensis TaxID=2705534 RepID=A0A7T0C010_9BACT|nr:MAG: hypothetical protein G3M78_00665 [Candidatus Nitrohelix vancouverensis]
MRNSLRPATRLLSRANAAILIGWIGSISLAVPAALGGEAETIVKTLDENYYFPQAQGLQHLQATVSIEQRDMTAQEPRYLNLAPARMSWKRHIRALQFIPLEGDKTDEDFMQSQQLLNNYKEMFLPSPLQTVLENYEGTLRKKSQHAANLLFQAKSPGAPIRAYDLLADTRQARIHKMRIEQRRNPMEVTVQFRYIEREGKWLVEETQAEFEINRESYTEWTRYSYTQVDGFWLADGILQELSRAGKPVQSYRFTLKDFKINSIH